MLLFAGDPHGDFTAIRRAALACRPEGVVLLGDCDLERPLAEELAEIVALGIPVHWIAGNHEADSLVWHRNLFQGGIEDGALDGQVKMIGGRRVAGLGGVFRARDWHPLFRGFKGATENSAADGTSVLPATIEHLASLKADILVCHEAPTSHRHGFREVDDLASALGVRLVIHGHHHENYTAAIAGGTITVIGVGQACVVDETGRLVLS